MYDFNFIEKIVSGQNVFDYRDFKVITVRRICIHYRIFNRFIKNFSILLLRFFKEEMLSRRTKGVLYTDHYTFFLLYEMLDAFEIASIISWRHKRVAK